jgi:hypothetical protein
MLFSRLVAVHFENEIVKDPCMKARAIYIIIKCNVYRGEPHDYYSKTLLRNEFFCQNDIFLFSKSASEMIRFCHACDFTI